MPHLLKTRHTKKHIPDREMDLQLDEEETKKFLEAFPEFAKLNIETYDPCQIRVTVNVSSFLKTKTDAVEEKN